MTSEPGGNVKEEGLNVWWEPNDVEPKTEYVYSAQCPDMMSGVL